MENASKALIIAGGMLIGIIIASIFAYEIIHMSETAKVYNKQTEMTQIAEFNAKFEKYANKDSITAQEVITIYNYINEWNQNNSETISIETNDKTHVFGEIIFQDVLDNSDNVEGFINSSYRNYGTEKRYKCIVSYSETNRTYKQNNNKQNIKKYCRRMSEVL